MNQSKETPSLTNQHTTLHTDIMIDIETASTQNNAVILSIGIVAFNVYDPTVKREELEILIDKKDGDNLGLHTCENTMKWWEQQKKEAIDKAFNEEPRFTTKEGLTQLLSFCKSFPKCKRYWCQGINFDPIVLENAFKCTSVEVPWKFYQLRDSRTIKDLLSYVSIKKPESAHSAIADCNYQIDILHYVYKRLRLTK